MKNTLYQKDIVSIKDLTRDQILTILKLAEKLKKKPASNLLNNKIIAHCFFEASTRTRLSFETATIKLGGKVIGFADPENISTKKGESLADTIQVINSYSDLIVIRHPKDGAARLAAEISDKPVINAGDGANQHPTQALLDLFTIQECQKKLAGINIALVGDLKYGRTVHSLVEACALFDIRFFLVAPESLTLPPQLWNLLKANNIKFSFHQSLDEIISKIDILYMTRLQRERLDKTEQQAQNSQHILVPALLTKAKANLKILHPLPRVDEIDPTIDKSPFAYYFQQAANAVWLRQALLTLLLNRSLS